jgi:hypothetical protein
MNQLSTGQRWTAAIIVAIALIVSGVLTYIVGLLPAVMGTDACSLDAQSMDTMSLYLVGFLPCIMLIGSLVPPALIVRGLRWYWVLASILLFAIVNAGVYIGWFGLVSTFC